MLQARLYVSNVEGILREPNDGLEFNGAEDRAMLMPTQLELLVPGPTELPLLVNDLADRVTPHLGISGAVHDNTRDGCLTRLGLTSSLMIHRLGEAIKLTKLRHRWLVLEGVRCWCQCR